MKAGTKKAKEAQQAQEQADAAAESLFVSNLAYLLKYIKASQKSE